MTEKNETTVATTGRSFVPSKDDPTIGRLVADASRDVSSLVRDEIALAKSELKVSIKAGGLGVGLFAGAALLGVLAIIMLSVAIAYLIHFTGLDLAWCFLIVFAFYLLVAGLLAMLGLRKVKQVKAPERAIHQAQETKSILRRGVSEPGPAARGPVDPVEITGPWEHRHVAANGARFHLAEAGPEQGPLVLLLHGFPEFWWAWRDQLPALAAAGYRAVAMDLRGYGGSDKTPNGYDPITLSQDVAGVVKALGGRPATLVGHGWGGYVGWATATAHPGQVNGLCTVAAPHPTAMLRALRGGHGAASLRHVLAMQVPWIPERRLADAGSGMLRDHLRAWSAEGSSFPDAEALATYQRAISQWPSSHCALEYHRWLVRSRPRADGRRFTAMMRPHVDVPVCCVSGDQDHALPARGIARSRPRVRGPFTVHQMSGVGHFPHEEDPAGFTALLLAWLGTFVEPAAAGLSRARCSRRC